MPKLNMFHLASFLCLLISQPALSHGYVSSPESRSFFCKQGGNSNCGAIQFEPQSVEGADGFPAAGPPDGQIAAGGQAGWAPLNEQTTNRWQKRVIKSGANNFSWHFTAPHVTKDYRYYITKTGWNPNQKLTRDSFELNPFCLVDGGMVRPPFDITHSCNVPARQGYHIILATWDVGDTAATFYQVLDVEVNGSGTVIPGTPGATPQPIPPTATATPTPKPGCDATGNKQCKALAGSGVTDQYCNANCNHNPSFCPANLCGCDGAAVPAPAGQGSKACKAVPGSSADDLWCNTNCNHTPSFCPASYCTCN